MLQQYTQRWEQHVQTTQIANTGVHRDFSLMIPPSAIMLWWEHEK